MAYISRLFLMIILILGPAGPALAAAVLNVSSETADLNAPFVDGSEGAHAVSAIGGVAHSDAAAVRGISSVYFDGIDDYLHVPDHDDWTFSDGDFTIDLWINRDGTTGRQGIMGQSDASGTWTGISFWIEAAADNTIQAFSRIGDQNISLTSVRKITDSEWHHLALVRKGGMLYWFVDGLLQDTESVSGEAVDAAGRLGIGVVGDTTLYWKGYMDDVRITKGEALWVTNFNPDDSGDGSASKWIQNGQHTVYTGAKVGIGTAEPDAHLQIQGADDAYTRGVTLKLANSDSSPWEQGDVSSGIEFVKEDTLNGYIRSVHTRSGGTHDYNDAGLVFGTAESDYSAVDRMVITSKGSVGIGTTAPDAYLQVQGSDDNYSRGVTLKLANADTSQWELGDISTGIEFVKEDTLNGYIRSVHTRSDGSHSFNDAGLVFGTAESDNPAVDRMVITHSGDVGIGTVNPQSMLAVNGTVTAKELIVTDTGWADYVFETGYDLRPLSEVESFVREKKHLPDVPSAKEIEDNGLSMARVMVCQMRKIEELTLYLIDMKRQNDLLEKRISVLESE